MRGLVGISCPKCEEFLTEQVEPGVFACRKCDLAIPVRERIKNKRIDCDRYQIAVPLRDVEDQ